MSTASAASTASTVISFEIIGQIFTYLDINKSWSLIHVIRDRATRRRIRRMWIAATKFYAVVNVDRKIFYANATIHRVGGPAIEFANGGYHYVQYGVLSRADGPALYVPGDEEYEWWLNGVMRYGGDDEWSREMQGGRMWLKDDFLHRDDGPALVSQTGFEKWYQFGKLHRENGPAYVDAVSQIAAWYRHGVEHRIGGPSSIYPGGEDWKQEGKHHREDGPAEITPDFAAWYRNDQRHRNDGPAIEYSDGRRMWYVNGVFIRMEYA